MKRCIFILISVLVSFSCSSQSVSNKRYRAENLYREAKQIGNKEIIGRYVTKATLMRIIEKYKEVSCEDKTLITSWINQALGYCTFQDYKNALAVLDSASIYTETDDDKSEINLYRGYILEDSGNSNEANVYYEKALQLSDKHSLNSIPTIIQQWEILLAAKGLEYATDYLSKELEGMNINSNEKEIYSKLLDKSVAHVMGRKFYIHSRASGLYIVTQQQLDELRFAYDTSKSLAEECVKDNPDFTNLVTTGFINKLSQKEQHMIKTLIADIRNHPRGGIDLTVMDKSGWYKVKYFIAGFERELLLNVTSVNGKQEIGNISFAPSPE